MTISALCEVRWCLGGRYSHNPAAISVSEVIGDGAFMTRICRPCADAIGIGEGGTLPEPDEVEKRLRQTKRNGINDNR